MKILNNFVTDRDLDNEPESRIDHWEMVKARVFIILFLVWVCFAVWGKYNA